MQHKQKVEYMVIGYYFDTGVDSTLALDDRLNEFARDGWKIAEIISGAPMTANCKIILEREVIADADQP